MITFFSLLPSPFNSESSSIDDELVEGLLCSHFCCLPRGKLDKGTLLPLDYGNGTNLTKLVKEIPAKKQPVELWQRKTTVHHAHRLAKRSTVRRCYRIVSKVTLDLPP